ncbi:MAG: flagellar basal-body rod protein FlgG [bacterium]
MIRSIFTAASGMKAQQMYVDNISHNLANVNTTAFKKSRLEFNDLMYQTMIEPGAPTSQATHSPTGLQVGLGVKSIANHKIYSQGSLTQTGSIYGMAIRGQGFFQVMRPDGTIAYTRDGSFKISDDGTLVSSAGFAMEPEIIIPEDAVDNSLQIDDDGIISVLLEGDEVATEIGQLELASFINPAGLKSVGDNLYEETRASGEPVLEPPGARFTGDVSQGYLENSNVEMVEEMVNLITAQRAYEISSKAVQVSEEMLQTANQIKR